MQLIFCFILLFFSISPGYSPATAATAEGRVLITCSPISSLLYPEPPQSHVAIPNVISAVLGSLPPQEGNHVLELREPEPRPVP